jgi:hypothetical protein
MSSSSAARNRAAEPDQNAPMNLSTSETLAYESTRFLNRQASLGKLV